MKPRLWQLAPALVCLLLLALAIQSYRAEPRYHGRSLTSWIHQARASDYPSEQPPETLEACAAIRAIGPRALPTLMRLLRAEDSGIKQGFAELLRMARVHPNFHWANEKHELALSAFLILGSNAAPVLPELNQMLFVPTTANRAATALAAIGPESVPCFRAALTNADKEIRFAGLNGLGQLPVETARDALPEVLSAYRGSNYDTAASALATLRWMLPRDQFQPILIEALHRSDLRFRALTEVHVLGTNAAPIFPVLLELLHDPTMPASALRLVTNALRRINAPAAAAAGVNTNEMPIVRPSPRQRRGG